MLRKLFFILLFIINLITIYANPEYSKRLIREYYRHLESNNISQAYHMFQKKITMEEFQEMYSEIQSINIDFIPTDANDKFSAIVYTQNTNGTFYFEKVNITTTTDEGNIVYLEELNSKKIKNPYTKEQLTVIKYYKFMQIPETLLNAYNLSTKNYSFNKYKSWYNYNRAHVDIEFISIKKENISFFVTFLELHQQKKLFFKYEVNMKIIDELIIESQSKQVKYVPLNIIFEKNDDREYIKKISKDDLGVLLGSLKDKSNLNLFELYNIYKAIENQEDIIRFLNLEIKDHKANKWFFHDYMLTVVISNLMYNKDNLLTYKSTIMSVNDLNAILRMCLDANLEASFEIKSTYSSPYYNLMSAIINGNDIELIRLALKKGGKILDKDVFTSVFNNRLDIFELLLKYGGNINSIGSTDNSDLGRPGNLYFTSITSGLVCYSVLNNDINLLKYLLEKGASTEVNYKVSGNGDIIKWEEEFNSTALAIKNNNIKILNLLLKAGASSPKGYSHFKPAFFDLIESDKNFSLDSLIKYYLYSKSPKHDIEIYTQDDVFYMHNIILDPYTAAVNNKRNDFVEYLEQNGVKQEYINEIIEITN